MESYVWQPPDDYLSPEYATRGIVETMPADAENSGFHPGRLTLLGFRIEPGEAVFVTAGDEIQLWAFAPGSGYCF